MNIKETMKKIHDNNVAKGFWEDKKTKNVGEVLMLCVSELAEALEAHRKGKRSDWVFDTPPIIQPEQLEDENFKALFETAIKDTFEDEIADTVIRLFDLCSGFGIDLEYHIEQKMRYNSLRPYKHNKAY